MIVVVDYGLGNLQSIVNIFKKIGVPAVLSTCPQDVVKADKLVLPGVGAFDVGIGNLKKCGYFDVLQEKVIQGNTPIMGICLGMQLMAHSSQEGAAPGLGWLDARVVRFRFSGENGAGHKIPHMGWNTLHPAGASHFFPDPQGEYRYYFVHSYHMVCASPADVLTTSEHGIEFTSSVLKDNIVGFQFHPEKSHKYGMELLKKFSDWDPQS